MCVTTFAIAVLLRDAGPYDIIFRPISVCYNRYLVMLLIYLGPYGIVFMTTYFTALEIPVIIDG
jgi:hypothetical protein